MKTLLLSLLLILSAELSAQWVRQTSGTGFNLFGSHFLSADTGFAVGYLGRILRTTNGGTTWVDKSLPTSENFNSVYFASATTGWILSDVAKVYHTTDLGETWQVQNPDVQGVRHIYFIDAQNGFAAGAIGSLSRTTDGGATWTQQPTGIQGSTFIRLQFTSRQSGWAVGSVGNQGALFRTTDGGTTWMLKNLQQFPVYLYSVFFIDESIGYASGYRETILKTTDAGESWSIQRQTASGQGLYSIAFVSVDTGYVVGDGKILYTTNGGGLWQQYLPSNFNRLEDIHFVSRTVGWIVGASGTILRTTNAGGLTGVDDLESGLPDAFRLEQNYPNPFNPTTTVRFQLTANSFVSLKVFDILGREVSTLVNEELQQGTYERTLDATALASGIYTYRLQAAGLSQTRRLVLLK